MVRSIVSGLSAEWIDSTFTSIQVSWDQDSTANYRIWYSPVVDYEGRTWMLQSSTAVTTDSNIILTELEPTFFYSVSVESVADNTETSPITGTALYVMLASFEIDTTLQSVKKMYVRCTFLWLYELQILKH